MIDLTQLLIYFLAIVCAPEGTQEIVVFPEHGEARFFIKDGSDWKEYYSGRPEQYKLERIENDSDAGTSPGYVGKWLGESTEIILTDEFRIENDVFESEIGMFLIPYRGGGIVVKKRKEGLNMLFENSRTETVYVRWKKGKR